jgi:hypothetical protein
LSTSTNLPFKFFTSICFTCFCQWSSLSGGNEHHEGNNLRKVVIRVSLKRLRVGANIITKKLKPNKINYKGNVTVVAEECNDSCDTHIYHQLFE